MFFHVFWKAAVTLATTGVVLGQYFPPAPDTLDTTVFKSVYQPGASVSYKETNICETTPNVKSHSGYVHLPASSSFHFPQTSYFFWFFESRKNPSTAPFVVWIGGGPGASSIDSAMGENGPCITNADSNSTTLNPWSWNNEVNILYIDQPAQVGYSYGVRTNGTVDQLDATGTITPADFGDGVPEANVTFNVGTFGSQQPNGTANSVGNGARIMWSTMQAWFEAFPHYKPENNKISLWSESYGGRYGPGYAAYFNKRNSAIEKKRQSAFHLSIDTLGLINGFIDLAAQGLSFPEYAYNNTYGLHAISEDLYLEAVNNFTKPDGCRDLVAKCQELARENDEEDLAGSAETNDACASATEFCFAYVHDAYNYSNRSQFDISHKLPDPFPTVYDWGFFNRHWVQRELGAVVNFTANSATVLANFFSTGDFARPGGFEDLAYLLDNGVKVALIYGDRDYQCNWFGGENASLAIPFRNQSSFQSAGYTPMITNSTYTGGLTRQFNTLSFTRVFEAGHEVPYYQPETAYRIFMRTMFGKDVATGNVSLSESEQYATKGPETIFDVRDKLPESAEPICYTWAAFSTCTDEQLGWLEAGTAVVKDFVVIGGPNETMV